MITLEMLCAWLKDATHDQEIKIWVADNVLHLETETHAYKLTLKGGV